MESILNDPEKLEAERKAYWDRMKVSNPKAWERMDRERRIDEWLEANQDQKWFRWCTSRWCACIGCIQNSHKDKPDLTIEEYTSWLQWKYRELRKQRQ